MFVEESVPSVVDEFNRFRDAGGSEGSRDEVAWSGAGVRSPLG